MRSTLSLSDYPNVDMEMAVIFVDKGNERTWIRRGAGKRSKEEEEEEEKEEKRKKKNNNKNNN